MTENAGTTTTPAVPGSSATPAPSPTPTTAPSATPAGSTPPAVPTSVDSADPSLHIERDTEITLGSDDMGDTSSAPPAPLADDSAIAATPPDGADKRVKDAQRRMHLATEQAAMLRAQVGQILAHPDLGPQAKAILEGHALVPATPDSGAADGIETDIQKAIQDYKAAPTDDAALMAFATALIEAGQKRTLATLEQRQQAVTTQRQVQAVQRNVVKAIEQVVQAAAPDVPLELFWIHAKRARAETPLDLSGIARIEWQTNRALELAKDVLTRATSRASSAASETVRIQQGAASIMPGGGAIPPATVTTPTPAKPPTFEQVWREQRHGVVRRPA